MEKELKETLKEIKELLPDNNNGEITEERLRQSFEKTFETFSLFKYNFKDNLNPIGDAPNDGKFYVRQNGKWVELPSVAPPVVKSLKGKTISIIGDSITAFQNGATKDYYLETGLTALNQDTGGIMSRNDMWYGVFAKETEGTLATIDGWRGSRVHAIYGAELAWRRVDAMDHTADYILVLMGTNDVHNQNTPLGEIKEKGSLGDFADKDNPNYQEFTSAYQIAIEKMIAKYPNSKIVLMTLLPAFKSKGSQERRKDIVYDYDNRIKELAELYGLNYIDTARVPITAGNNAEYLIDGLHPTKKGMEVIGKFVADYMRENIL